MPSASSFFTSGQQAEIISAIRSAEHDTAGEIRVHIETSCKGNVLDRAAYIFEKLGMHKTKQRNGVLFYLAVEKKQFAVLGDAGINAVVPDLFWEELKDGIASKFREGLFVEGLCEAVAATGKYLHIAYPYASDDVNELPDEISFGTE